MGLMQYTFSGGLGFGVVRFWSWWWYFVSCCFKDFVCVVLLGWFVWFLGAGVLFLCCVF